MLSVNLLSYAFMIKAALPHLRPSGRGSIVNVSSTYALSGRAGMGQYDATKAALMSTVELRGSGEPTTEGTVFAAPQRAGEVTGRWRSVPVRALVLGGVGALGLATVWARARRQRNPSD